MFLQGVQHDVGGLLLAPHLASKVEQAGIGGMILDEHLELLPSFLLTPAAKQGTHHAFVIVQRGHSITSQSVPVIKSLLAVAGSDTGEQLGIEANAWLEVRCDAIRLLSGHDGSDHVPFVRQTTCVLDEAFRAFGLVSAMQRTCIHDGEHHHRQAAPNHHAGPKHARVLGFTI